MKQELPGLQSGKQLHSRADVYRTYRLAGPFNGYNATVMSYISKMVMKVKSQVEAHFFVPSNLVLIIGFLATFELTCDTKRVYAEAAMWVLPFFVMKALTTTVNSGLSAATQIAPVVASVNTV